MHVFGVRLTRVILIQTEFAEVVVAVDMTLIRIPSLLTPSKVTMDECGQFKIDVLMTFAKNV